MLFDQPVGSRKAGDRRAHKCFMIGYKGGKCVDCQKRVTATNMETFHFDHIIPLNDQYNSSDRWAGGGVSGWAPFTPEWFTWGDTVQLLCEDCHKKKTRNSKQLSMADFLEVQCRLNDFNPGPMPSCQEAWI